MNNNDYICIVIDRIDNLMNKYRDMLTIIFLTIIALVVIAAIAVKCHKEVENDTDLGRTHFEVNMSRNHIDYFLSDRPHPGKTHKPKL